MKRKKERFRIIEENSNVVEPSKALYNTIKGNWRSQFFKNENPICVELACGRGEYTVGLARLFPDRNFIGVDIKGERIWKGSTIAIEEKLNNVGFLRTHIIMIESFFAEGEIDEIWITFPDPRPKKRDIKRRLTSDRYISVYKKLTKPGSYVRLKTDNTPLYEYSLEEAQMRNDITDLQFTDNLYESPLRPECFDIKTKYEQMFASKGELIKYMRYKFNESMG